MIAQLTGDQFGHHKSQQCVRVWFVSTRTQHIYNISLSSHSQP
jgi:hypothetical protein